MPFYVRRDDPTYIAGIGIGIIRPLRLIASCLHMYGYIDGCKI